MTTTPTPSSTTEHPTPLSVDGQPILFPKLPYKMDTRAPSFLNDPKIQEFVNRATLMRDTNRKAYTRDFFGSERHDKLRTLAGQIKQHTLENLDTYLNQFIDNAEAAGATVHFAKDAAEANSICIDIAKREKLTACVKAKSMVTEETHLLPALEAIGVEVLETDLGEFILQIDDDAPSHIVTPMIHKDKIAVAKAFERELGAKYTEDEKELTTIAREYLRDKFQRADLGISGGNFLVAETGSIAICTNEGNGRFSTTAPRVHVAFVGIEKCVPGMNELGVLLKLLAKHATAQPLTCYTHIMTGPKRDHEHDGPEQMHIILIDNGRTKVLADPEYREALRCIRCGACLNACPVYRKVSGHAYGAVYSGPIGAVLTPLFKGLGNYKDLPSASSLCGACYEACPVKIDIPKMLIKLRRDMISGRVTAFFERLAYKIGAFTLASPLRYKITGFFQRKILRLLANKKGYITKAPGPIKGWTDVRDLKAPAKEPFRQWWDQRQK